MPPELLITHKIVCVPAKVPALLALPLMSLTENVPAVVVLLIPNLECIAEFAGELLAVVKPDPIIHVATLVMAAEFPDIVTSSLTMSAVGVGLKSVRRVADPALAVPRADCNLPLVIVHTTPAPEVVIPSNWPLLGVALT